MTPASSRPLPPKAAGPSAGSGQAAEEPRPWGGWGFLTGGFAIWAVFVLLRHLKVLGVTPSLLGRMYAPGQYPGSLTGGEWLLVWAGHAWHLAAAGAMAFAAFGYGRAAFRLLRLDAPARGLSDLAALAAGGSILGLALLGGGLVGLWRPLWPVALIVAGGWLGWRERDALRGLVPPRPQAPALWPAAVLLGATGLLILGVALSPEVFYDSQVYHLAVPAAWIKAHKITALPYNFFSNFPFTFEMLFGAGMMLGHESIAKLAHAATSFAAAGMVGATAAWIAGTPGAGWLAAMITLTTPLIGNSAWMTGIDAGLILYEAGSVAAFLVWWERRKPGWRGWRGESHWLLVSAVLGGLGMGAKYTVGLTVLLLGAGAAARIAAPDGRQALRGWMAAFLAAAVPWTGTNIAEVRAALPAGGERVLLAAGAAAFAGTALWLARRWGWRASARGVGIAAAYGAAAGLCVSPWNMKSLLFERNPVFPFAFRLFPSFHVREWGLGYQMGEFREYSEFGRPFLAGAGQDAWLRHPWWLTENSGFSNNSACGAFFLAALPLLLVFRRTGPRYALLGAVTAAKYLVWCNLTNIIRYFAPGLALAGILYAAASERFCAPRPYARAAARLAALAFAAVNLAGLLVFAQGSASFLGTVLGLETERDFYVRERPSYPNPPFLGCEAMNRSLPARAGVLFVGEARGMFLDRRLKASTVFDHPVLVELAGEARSPAELTRRLKQFGLTHVYLNLPEGMRTSGYRIFDWTGPRALAVAESWWGRHLELIWASGGQEVYAIAPDGAATRSAAFRLAMLPFDEYKELSTAQQAALRDLQTGRLAEAAAAARELVARAPGVADAHELLAQSLALADRNREALAAYRQAVGLGLVSSAAHRNIAVLLQRLGRTAEAAREISLATELDARFGGAR